MGTPVSGSGTGVFSVRWCRNSCVKPGGSFVILMNVCFSEVIRETRWAVSNQLTTLWNCQRGMLFARSGLV